MRTHMHTFSSGGGSGSGSSSSVMSEVSAASVATRAIGTVYQNTTGKPLLVSVAAQNSGTNGCITANTGATSSPATPVAQMSGQQNGDGLTNLQFFVLLGNYYEVVATNGTQTLLIWREYELASGTFLDSGDIVGTRVSGTIYQNTGATTLFVVAQSNTLSTGDEINCVCDGNASPTTVVDQQVISTYGAYGGPLAIYSMFPVPAGYYYKVTVTTSGSGVLAHWHEYSWAVPCLQSLNLLGANPGSLPATGQPYSAGPYAPTVPRTLFGPTGISTPSLESNGTTTQWENAFGLQSWQNGSKMTWVAVISQVAVGGNAAAILSDNGIPAYRPVTLVGAGNGLSKTLRAPVLPNQFYTYWDYSSSNNITGIAWIEYTLG